MSLVFRFLRVCALVIVSTVAAVAAPDPVKRPTGTSKPSSRKVAASHKVTRSLAPVRPAVVMPTSEATPVDYPVTLRGGVKGRNGMPLAGATIWISGTTKQVTVTNAAGNFNIVLPDAGPIGLSCGYGGYKQQSMFLQAPSQQQDVFFTLQALDGRRKH
ncbi:carboxypeptidase-like regulatory domain-containing protein [Hymenobacter wooponensis]|uniref:Carboxypeptidase-like regulatory domain-containing protein n=1 Tax=Hymenobacter wooponensis TaxID=1525360 RepID=A0A4Z0MK92_9BACT|nr:carboxypeptidase-like regulatory domain-containing protein [Hymenobacter wooponensis]TGD79809.1 hypothetical protein EU557_16490 [Hymenobacter wooponensis]